MNKKQKKKLLVSSIIGAITTTAVATPIIIWQLTKNGYKSSETNSLSYIAPKQFKEPVTLKYVDGMISDSKKYDELIAERVKNIVKTQDENYLKFETDEVTFLIDKPSLEFLKSYLTDDDIEKIIIYLSSNSNFNLTSKYHSPNQKLFCQLVINDPEKGDLGYATGDSSIVLRIDAIVNQIRMSLGQDFSVKSNKNILKNVLASVYFHELGHVLQYDLSQSRSSIWYQGNKQKINIKKQLLQDIDMSGKDDPYKAYLNIFTSLNRRDVFTSIVKYIYLMQNGMPHGTKNYEPPRYQRNRLMIERYYNHNTPIFSKLGHLNFQLMEGNGSSFFGYRAGYFTEFMTRLQASWMITYNGWGDIINKFGLAFGEQIETAWKFNLNLYPLDTSFSRKFMAAYFKYFMGIGDANNLEIKRDDGTNKDHVWFGATSTTLSKRVKQVKLVYPDGTFTLDLQTKDYPIGWNYQPWTVGEKFYKYVARTKYGYMTIPHHDALPQKITFLDQDNNELSNEDVQLLHGEVEDSTNVMVRYIFNDVTSAWEENYQNT